MQLNFVILKCDLIVHLAIGHDSTPATFDQPGELFEGAQSLPTQLGFPPDGAFVLQVADHNPIDMSLTDGNLIDADGARSRCSNPIHQLLKNQLSPDNQLKISLCVPSRCC